MDDQGVNALEIVVIGGGLAGLSAALEVAKNLEEVSPDIVSPMPHVTLIEKEPRLGGNSAKASSGMNALTPSQGDNFNLFFNDCKNSGSGLSEESLLNLLVGESEDALKFIESYGVDLGGVTILGGHSKPRTHFNLQGPNVGFAIIQKLASAVENHKSIDVITGARVTDIQRSNDDNKKYVIKFQIRNETDIKEASLVATAVILATGGFGANKTMLEKYAGENANYATTNGEWTTGDGMVLGEALGGVLKDMEQVQIHPTGFIDPADPNAGTKFLAAEKLRGSGAIMLNLNGSRFVDELNRRDHVFSKLAEQPGQVAWLLISEEGVEKFQKAAMGFYLMKGLFSKFDDINLLAEHMRVPVTIIKSECLRYNIMCSVGKDEFGKTQYPTKISLESTLYVAQVTPVVHYCMGGLRIDESAHVVSETSKEGWGPWGLGGNKEVVERVYAAGEVTGGVHGKNRLGGNSLLDCVVFGRISGKTAAKEVISLIKKIEL